MKILVLADLHLDQISCSDFRNELGQAIEEAGREAEALIIAGDLTERAAERWPDAIRWLNQYYPSKQTILIPGNHDYYGGSLDSLDAELSLICRDAGCTFGQCLNVCMGNTRILMATLWTDMRLYEGKGAAAVAESIENAQLLMPDYAQGAITLGASKRPATPYDTIDAHNRQREWLVKELARPWAGKTLIVTHHTPLRSALSRNSLLSPCFASDLGAIVHEYRPDAWLFGHTHHPVSYVTISGTVLQNASLGYSDELTGCTVTKRVRAGLIELESCAGAKPR
ncbi:metallophosphoesterase [Falsigemmobacter intermedius]|nr:metallophosphoesterase [Falsigemmobacter intermedius]